MDGYRNEDFDNRHQPLSHYAGREAVVDDSAFLSGVRRILYERIYALPGPKEPIYKTFSIKGYLIIAFMITLGITLKYIPGIPESFFAWFYMGLGPGLLSAGIRFLIRWFGSYTYGQGGGF